VITLLPKNAGHMLFAFLAGSMAAIILYALWWWLIVPRCQQARWQQELVRHGREAEAVVLSLEFTGVYINNEPQVKMLVHVLPATEENFVAEMREVISIMELSYLRAGTMLRVKFIPHNTKRVQMVKRGELHSSSHT